MGLLLAVGLGITACTSEGASGTARAPVETDTVQAAAAASAEPDRPPEPVPAPDADRSLAQRLDDARLEARVKQALMQRRDLRVFAFDLAAVGGRVTLRGDVNTAEQYRTAARTVRRVPGVEAVANELTIGGRPVTDERLRALSDKGASADGSEDPAVYHTVQRGESLWRIARKYGTSVQRLRALNDLRTGALRPGQRLRVR